MTALQTIYGKLLDAYGPQGWWPLLGFEGENSAKTGAVRGYHRGDYSFPHTLAEQFEICIGAILTQNTAWLNVEKALLNLAELHACKPDAILDLSDSSLQQAIRPSGYYKVKTRKLREFSRFYQGLGGRVPGREELLAVWGVGPETADSIRLYAFKQPEMVVDTYTRRILGNLKLTPEDLTYEPLKKFCVDNLRPGLVVYQEFHALMVEHAKRYYRRRPYRDPLLASSAKGL